MENGINFDTEDFQEKVWKEYDVYGALQKSKGVGQELNKGFRTNKQGCLALPFVWFVSLMIKKAYKDESKKRNYVELEKEATELVAELEIKKSICDAISKLNRQEILTEEYFVKITTKTLLETKLVKKFVIPQNAVLYGIIAHQVFQSGLENYCEKQQT